VHGHLHTGYEHSVDNFGKDDLPMKIKLKDITVYLDEQSMTLFSPNSDGVPVDDLIIALTCLKNAFDNDIDITDRELYTYRGMLGPHIGVILDSGDFYVLYSSDNSSWIAGKIEGLERWVPAADQ
jgi:hypothetical protein